MDKQVASNILDGVRIYSQSAYSSIGPGEDVIQPLDIHKVSFEALARNRRVCRWSPCGAIPIVINLGASRHCPRCRGSRCTYVCKCLGTTYGVTL